MLLSRTNGDRLMMHKLGFGVLMNGIFQSLESCGTYGGRRWKKKQQLKVTGQKPFKLRTEVSYDK